MGKHVLICQHGGSKNHGCEALARTVHTLIRTADPSARITLYTYNLPEDIAFLGSSYDICGLDHLPARWSFHNIGYHVKKRLGLGTASKLPLTGEFKSLVNDADLILAIGGDNYCYNRGVGFYGLDRYIKSCGKKYAFLGTSIEPEDLPHGLGEHLKLFDKITVRESISMEAMADYGLKNIVMLPDSAFLLEPNYPKEPLRSELSNTVGINVSPMVMKNESIPGMTMKNFIYLCRFILENTDMNIALIPHVTWPESNDSDALATLASNLGASSRITQIGEKNAMDIKGVIGSLRFFVGARTHSTIAAYSTCVPTLTLGYSVKARGIARDLFGQEEGYLISVQDLAREDMLSNAFIKIMGMEEDIKNTLHARMPSYKQDAERVSGVIKELLNG